MEITVSIDERDMARAARLLNMSREEFQEAFRKFVEIEFMAFTNGISKGIAEDLEESGKARAWEILKEKYLQ